jgi:hypothetical protein
MPWTRRTWVVLALLVIALVAALPWFVTPWHPIPGNRDGAMYLACAKSLVAGEGYSYLGEPFVIRPPGMSLLVAPIVATRGFDFEAINWLVSLFGVAAAAAIFAWCVPRVGGFVAAALAVTIWWNGTFQEFCNRAMSDVPGLATLFGCLLIARWSEGCRSWRREIILGLAIGLSAYLRTAAVLLVPAIAVERIVARFRENNGVGWLAFARDRLALLLVVPVLVIAPWHLRDAVRAPHEEVDQTEITSYWAGMWYMDPSDPNSARVSLVDVLARVPGHATQVLSLVGTAMKTDEASAVAIAFGVLVLALAALTLLRARRSSEIYLFGYATIVAVYFGLHKRLVLPIWALALVAAVEALLGPGARPSAFARRAIVVLGLVALTALEPSPWSNWGRLEAQHTRFARFADALKPALPPEARVGAPFGWHYALFLDRPVWTLQLAFKGDPKKVDKLIAKYRLDTVIVGSRDGAARELLAHLVERYGPGERVDSGLVFRVR